MNHSSISVVNGLLTGVSPGVSSLGVPRVLILATVHLRKIRHPLRYLGRRNGESALLIVWTDPSVLCTVLAA